MFLIDFLANFLKYLLDSYLSFSSPLWALVLLSLSVFLIMLPLYKFGDMIVLRNKHTKELMQVELDSIQKLTGSTKKYFYTKEIYRRFGYNPLHSLSGLLGLLLQIPFFMAAYLMLHNYTAFKGISAGIFANLSAPDGLLQLWDIPIHLLPLLMTALNLLSAYFYTIADKKRNKLQLWLFPTIFLLLLYSQPVALVFYWTMNNVFSLLKNIWGAWRWAKRTGQTQCIRIAIPRFFDSNHWGPVQARLFFSILCFAAFLSLIYLGYSDKERSLTTMFYQLSLSLWLLLYGTILGQFLHQQKNKRYRFLSLSLLAVIVSLILLLFYWEQRYYGIPTGTDLRQQLAWRGQMLGLRITALVAVVGALFWQLQLRPRCSRFSDYFLPIPSNYAVTTAKSQAKSKLKSKLRRKPKFSLQYFYAVLSIFFGILLLSPLRTMSSDLSQLGDSNPLAVAALLLLFCIVAVLLSIVLFWVLPRLLQHYAIFFATFWALFVSFNILLFPGDYGPMEFATFQQNLEISNQEIAASLLLLFACLVAASFLKKLGLLSWILVLEVVLTGNYSWANYSSFQGLRQSQYSAQASPQSLSSPKNTENDADTAKPIRLSRTHNNVIIIMLDRFMGGYVPSIFEADPELAKEFEDFVYYPNTVSQANMTYGGFHPILGGAEYTVEKMNQNQRSLAADIIDAYSMIPKALSPLGYDSTFVNVKLEVAHNAYAGFHKRFDELSIRNYSANTLNYQLLPQPDVLGQNRGLEIRWQNFFALLGLFQGLGPTFRKKIYANGYWLNMIGGDGSWASLAFFSPYLELLSLRQLTELRDDDKGAYILVHNHLPHNSEFPGAYQYYGNPAYFAYPLPPVPSSFIEFDQKHQLANRDAQTMFYADYHSLRIVSDWLKQLKQLGVYDNTIIYLTSDHGYSAFDPSFTGQQQDDERLKMKAQFHSLYMRKLLRSQTQGQGQGEEGPIPLQTSAEFRTMADVPAEFLPSLGVERNPHSGKVLLPVQSQPLPLYKITAAGRNEELVNNDSEYYVYQKYWLKNDNIFEDSNWIVENKE